MNRFGILTLILFFVFIAGSTVFYTFSQCGWKTLLLGNGATMAAVTGMCD